MQELEEMLGIEEEEIIDHTYRPLGLRRSDLPWAVPYLGMASIVALALYLLTFRVVSVLEPVVELAAQLSLVLVPFVTPLFAAIRRVRTQLFWVLFGAHLLATSIVAVVGVHAAHLGRGDNFAPLAAAIFVVWLLAVSPAAPIVLALRALITRVIVQAKRARERSDNMRN